MTMRFSGLLFTCLIWYYYYSGNTLPDITPKELIGRWNTVDTGYTNHLKTLVVEFHREDYMTIRDQSVYLGVDIYALIKRNHLQYINILEADAVFLKSEILHYDSTRLRRIYFNTDTLTIENLMEAADSTPPIRHRFLKAKN